MRSSCSVPPTSSAAWCLRCRTRWVWLILAYYFVATLLPIDKIIGKIYPIFGVALILMALALLGVLLFGPYRIPELTTLANAQLDPHSVPIVPTLFITIACGAISGFHATQSPLMARCVRNERECRSVFFGAMISESIIALIWAAVAMAFFGGAHALAEALAANGNSAAWAVNIISNTTLGIAGGILALLGVVAAPITSGDTAFRSARLIVADIFRIEQRTQWKRFAIALPLFVAGYLITRVDFTVVWRYFAWTNQTLATIVLWAVVVWLFATKRNYFVALLPAVFMTFICASFVFVSGQFFGMENRPAAYALAGAATAVVLCFILLKTPPQWPKQSLTPPPTRHSGSKDGATTISPAPSACRTKRSGAVRWTKPATSVSTPSSTSPI